MAEARLPSIASGNGRLLVTVDARGEVLSACWPNVDSPNQFAAFEIRPAPGQASEATPEPSPPRYVDETNISTSQSQQGLQFTDVVVDDIERNGTQVDFFARKGSGPHPALRLLLQPNMDGRPGAQTIYWDGQSQALLAFCRRRWLAVGSARGRVTGFHCGRLGSPSEASKFVDAGRLPGERIAFREVDGILELGQSTDDTIILAVFGRTREEVLAGLKERRDHQWTQFESLAKERATEVLTESTLQGWSPAVTRMLRRSSLVWDVLTNRSTGGMIAGPDVQSGIASAPGYAAFWARDAAWALLGTVAMGQYALSKSVLEFAWATQSPEGLWLHRHHTDHSVASSWGLHQIDETGIILHCFKKYIDATGDTVMLTQHWTGVETAAAFLMNSRDPERGIPLPSVDLWEEREGFHLYTAASTIGGLRATAALAEKLQYNSSAAKLWISVADDIQQRTEAQFWDEKCGRFVSSLENSAALSMPQEARQQPGSILRTSLSPSSSQSSSNLETPRPDSADRIPRFPKFLDSTQRGSAKDQISDLELMHHYTSAAYRTFSSWEGVRQTLQCHVPREGFTQPLLLYQILAFSGFHLAYLHPERRHSYLVQASLHQDQAVAGINSALAAGVTSVNCHALCEVYHRAYESLDGLIDQDLRKGPLEGLFAGKSGPTAPSEHIRFLVDQLLDLKRQLSEPSADRAGADTDLVLEAVDLLAECLLSVHQNYSFSAPAEVRAALLWPLRMPDGFLALVQQREPLAMVLLAHYCVLLRYAEMTCWFIKGWAATLITIIGRHVGGGPFFLWSPSISVT
ncbi:hypothetical protein FSARC_6789 [Fusarium sarcochroum]|uniref:GH15-like domain-containing protein n=1 Tax=Fusarium sarcochroum TaxID=1208366 RepID=A0A8H4TWR3_9HYPO|nr:hypothetical protein FSARC_6789 [Fusarium sarcochroum]